MDKREQLFILSGADEMKDKEYYITEGINCLHGIIDTDGREVLPQCYDRIDTLWYFNQATYVPGPGVIVTRNGFCGFFCNEVLILPCLYEQINIGCWEGCFLELIVKREGLYGILFVDLSTNRYIDIIPAIYNEIRLGHLLISCFRQSSGLWLFYTRPSNKDLKKTAYCKRGEFSTITKGYSEPYPLNGAKILLPVDRACYGVDWEEVDSIEEVREKHQYSKAVIRTIYSVDGKFGLKDDDKWKTKLICGLEMISPVDKSWIDESNEDCSFFIVKKNGKEGVYDAEKRCFVLNTIFDEVSFISKPREYYVSETFLAKLNGEVYSFSLNGDMINNGFE